MSRSTLSKKAAKAAAKSAGALNLFRSAAAELEGAAKEHDAVAREAGIVVARHQNLKDEHVQQRDEASTAASKLRALVGGQAG